MTLQKALCFFPLVKDVARDTETNKQAREEKAKKPQAKTSGNKKIHTVSTGYFSLRRLIQKLFLQRTRNLSKK